VLANIGRLLVIQSGAGRVSTSTFCILQMHCGDIRSLPIAAIRGMALISCGRVASSSISQVEPAEAMIGEISRAVNDEQTFVRP
jgi:hypothetical protein